MDLTLADQYYLKALDYYPNQMEFAIENVGYALAYEEDHPQANCLMGRIYMYDMKDYHLAEKYFQKALKSDLSYTDTYKYLGLLKIWKSDLKGALKLIRYAKTVKAMDQCMILSVEARAFECLGEYYKASNILKQAKLLSLDCLTLYKINTHLSRVKQKIKTSRKMLKKRKKRMAIA